jgi:alpha-amylase
MQVLADFESRNIRVMKNRKSAKALRTLPPEKAFHFACSTGFIGYAAYSLDQFYELLPVVPADSIAYHQDRGDIARWIETILGDQKLAESVKDVRERHELLKLVGDRREVLWSHLR